MNVSKIAATEKAFRTTGQDNNGKQFKLTPTTVTVPGTSEKFEVILCRRDNNDKSFYYEEAVPKERILLHFTMGYLKGDIARLTTPGEHVSVAFVLARSGDIYGLFDSKWWSYHLGPSAVGGNKAMSSSSVAIEISNIGPLKASGTDLVTTYSASDVYCALTESAYYTKLAKSYRGYSYYASFTDAQYTSLTKLLRLLTKKYNIPRTFLGAENRYATLEHPENVKGILSHVNFRPDKADIGPAFDWNRLIAGVTAP